MEFFYVKFGDVTTEFFLTKLGILQGSVIGPNRFILFIDKLISKTFRKFKMSANWKASTPIRFFANDIAQITNDPQEVQKMLDIAVEFFKKAPRLSFGTNKCEVIAENSDSEMVKVNMNGKKLKTVSKLFLMLSFCQQ